MDKRNLCRETGVVNRATKGGHWDKSKYFHNQWKKQIMQSGLYTSTTTQEATSVLTVKSFMLGTSVRTLKNRAFHIKKATRVDIKRVN